MEIILNKSALKIKGKATIIQVFAFFLFKQKAMSAIVAYMALFGGWACKVRRLTPPNRNQRYKALFYYMY